MIARSSVGLESVEIALAPNSPRNATGFIESLNGKILDELLISELFDTLSEARVLIERCHGHDNKVRLRCFLDQRPPAPEAVIVNQIITENRDSLTTVRSPEPKPAILKHDF